ncbi:hypothetical protein [Nonomuraea solani]|uniref:hypothetical protein n=1 Tax=Nonomuraea solani TaxID=1144553 RepID=UPI000CDE9C41|nr:hypothetical protein [Nonomuraea solani]
MSAIVLALGLTGAGATPFIVQSASASSVAAYDPVEGCDVDVETCEETTPETTVTTTITAPTPEEEPETTITKTVTATPTKTTKSPTPKKSTTPPPASTPASTPDNPQPLPTQSVEVPPATSSTPTTEPSVEMPAIAPSESLPATTSAPSESQVASSSEEVPLELRAGTPEFDQRTLTQRLSIPALVLVLLALFAVLIFEGRLRRMAHAAAVRKAGPHAGAGQPNAAPMGGGYPAGPGYATAGFPAPGYPGGTAYAPIISFVPVQTYPSGPPQYADPNHPYPPQAYVQEPPTAQAPPPEPVVLHPDDFDSYNHEPPVSRERDMFEPLVPAEPPPSDIPPGGATPYEDGVHDQQLGAASAAEPGDSEPWQQQPGSLFEPASKPSHDQPSYDPPPYVPADEDVTAVTPLPEPQPPQEPTKEMPDPKRRRFGRKK